jgi:uncharacterized membrane protein (UPF0127 family)
MNMTSACISSFAALLLSSLIALQPSQAAIPARLLAEFPQTSIVMLNDDGPCVLLDVWVAASPKNRSRGLMFIEELGTYEGMIFLYQQPIDIAMWMKNTLIPLDMFFIRSDKTVARIAENTTPLSTDTIYSGEPVQMVLELAGGSAARWGFKPGNIILFNESSADTSQ